MNKFTYYININSDGWVEIDPKINQLKHSYKIDNDHEGHELLYLEGFFVLSGTDFDSIVAAKIANHIILIKIYENGDIDTGTLIYSGQIESFNEFDYNESTVILKDFITLDDYTDINKLIDSQVEKKLNFGTDYELWDTVTPFLISSYSKKFESIIIEFLGGGTFDDSDAWYNVAAIDISKLRITDAKNLRFAPLPDANTESQKITIKAILYIFEILFRAYWYLESGKLKFKTPEDFCTNILDVSTDTEYLKRKTFVKEMKISKEGIKFNSNNQNQVYALTQYDEGTNVIQYTTSFNKSVYTELKDIFTYFHKDMKYNTNGFLLSLIDTGNNVEVYDGIINGWLSTKTIITNYYRKYISTDNKNYTYCGTSETVKPIYFRPFIELPDVSQVLPSIATFIDGIKYEVDGTYEMIGRVWEMSTDLDSGLTTFKTFEFSNSIN